MKYLNQVTTVTKWEFRRFYKPKNEVIGILVMLLVSTLFYFGSKFAFSESGNKKDLYVLQGIDSLLEKKLSEEFRLNILGYQQAEKFKTEISSENKKILFVQNNSEFQIFSYKNTRAVKKIKSIVHEFKKIKELSLRGINVNEFKRIMSPAEIRESFVIKETPKNREILPYIFAGLMIMGVFLSFAYQFTAITGEKQLKITEQIVSAIYPQVWMDGKILGISLTGLLSMATYSLMGTIGGMLYFQFTDIPVWEIFNYLYLPSILLFLPFVLMGVLIWNAFMAGIASAITDPNNSGKSSLMLLPLLFVTASFFVMRDPDAGLSVILSWFPLTSATAMPMLWTVSEVSSWQVIGSFLLLILTFWLFRKIAAKIFRVSILISGKEPTFKELLRFAKEN